MLFFRLLALLVGFVLVFNGLTRKYLNPYKLNMVIGKKGSGKTTLLTKLAIKALKKGKTVYSTVEIPGTYLFDPLKVGDFTFKPNSLVLIDEVGLIWDNRNFKNFNSKWTYFFKMQRQYKCEVWLFSQSFDVDKKIRDLCDRLFIIQNFIRVFTIIKPVIKKITVSNNTQTGEGSLVDSYSFDIPLISWKFTFIPRWVVFFKSFDPKELAYIDGKYLDFNDVQESYLSGKKWLSGTAKVYLLMITHSIGRFIRKLQKKFRKVY